MRGIETAYLESLEKFYVQKWPYSRWISPCRTTDCLCQWSKNHDILPCTEKADRPWIRQEVWLFRILFDSWELQSYSEWYDGIGPVSASSPKTTAVEPCKLYCAFRMLAYFDRVVWETSGSLIPCVGSDLWDIFIRVYLFGNGGYILGCSLEIPRRVKIYIPAKGCVGWAAVNTREWIYIYTLVLRKAIIEIRTNYLQTD